MKTVWDSKGFASYKKYKDCLDTGLFNLSQCLIKMRFLNEFNEPTKQLKLEQTQQEQCKNKSIRTYGMDLLQLPFNQFSAEELQQTLNQLLLEESDPMEVQKLVEKGAQIKYYFSRTDRHDGFGTSCFKISVWPRGTLCRVS